MRNFFAAILFVLFLATVQIAQSDEINIIPKPRSVVLDKGVFKLTKETRIVTLNSSEKQMAVLLREQIRDSIGLDLKIEPRIKEGFNTIVISTNNAKVVTDVAGNYTIDIDKDRADLYASYPIGLFYAIQTFRQLLPAGRSDSVDIPAVRIEDSPRFSYRGMHLDVSRHFQPVEFVKKFIDQMAQYKFNTFHWHLTDDQGWRIEIKKYPRLTTVGQYRSESHEGSYSTIFKGDGRPVEGFYTQDQIKDVVAYAKERHITVIPEIELPGHASAALAAYPELGKGCAAPDYKFEVKKTWGIFKEVFCPTDETFKFLEDVLDETIKLFPDSPYIHIGGDEVLKDYWKESAFVQELKKRENLKDEHEVQSYFIRRIEKFVNSKGKKIIGWDEILEGGIAPNATIMSWRGMNGGIAAAKAGHDVIMTPTTHVYFDYGQGDPAYEPLNIGGYVPLEKVYSFEPVPPELTAEESKYILGGQANIWTEYIETPQQVEYMAFPRMLALSEVLWSKKEDRDFADFMRRLNVILPRLDKQGVNYRIPEPRNLGNIVLENDQGFAIRNIYSDIPGAKVLHTTDGSEPTESSPVVPAKLLLSPKQDEVLTLKTIVVLPNGRKSVVYPATIVRGRYLEPVVISDPKPGLQYQLFTAENAPMQSFLGSTRSLQLNQIGREFDRKEPFRIEYAAAIRIPADGVYEFQLDSTWESMIRIGNEAMKIDGKPLVELSGSKDRTTRSGIVPLRAGYHRIRLVYHNFGGEPHFRMRWGIKGRGLTQAWGGEFVH